VAAGKSGKPARSAANGRVECQQPDDSPFAAPLAAQLVGFAFKIPAPNSNLLHGDLALLN